VLIGITLLLFLLLYVVPGDPARVMVPKGASPQVIKNIQEKFGLDQPLYIQYFKYLGNILKGDFGISYRFRRPVIDILAEHYPNSVKLALAAILIEIIIGILAGVISAVRQYSFLDTVVTLSTTLAVCIPVFWLGMMLQVFFGLKLGWLPISGMGDGSWRYYILPSLTLASVSTAYVARMTRSSLLEVLHADYVRTAYAKGLTERQVIFVHALKNALIPVVTIVGLDLGALMGGAILTETVFSWPGIGRVIYLAVLQRDAPVVLGGTLILLLIFLFLNLLVDVSYAFLDPRIRYGEKGQ
jgi:peptide/nickel transport system permease protein